MKKWVKSMTYPPKIDAVRSGECRQTIRKGDKVSVGDSILWHGWEGRPYRTPWSWRMRVTVTEAIPVLVDYNDGVGVFDTTYNLHRWYAWDCAQINDLAKRDCIDPPIGLALRDVLAGLNGRMSGAEYQVIRW